MTFFTQIKNFFKGLSGKKYFTYTISEEEERNGNKFYKVVASGDMEGYRVMHSFLYYILKEMQNDLGNDGCNDGEVFDLFLGNLERVCNNLESEFLPKSEEEKSNDYFT
jgi:hypothetical protein